MVLGLMTESSYSSLLMPLHTTSLLFSCLTWITIESLGVFPLFCSCGVNDLRFYISDLNHFKV